MGTETQTMEPLLTPGEVATVLRVTVQAVYQMKHRGQLPYVTVCARGVRFRRDDVDAYIKNRRQTA